MSLPWVIVLAVSLLLNLLLFLRAQAARDAVIMANELLCDTRADLELLMANELKPQGGDPKRGEAEILQLLEDIEQDARSKEELSPVAAGARDEWLAEYHRAQHSPRMCSICFGYPCRCGK